MFSSAYDPLLRCVLQQLWFCFFFAEIAETMAVVVSADDAPFTSVPLVRLVAAAPRRLVVTHSSFFQTAARGGGETHARHLHECFSHLAVLLGWSSAQGTLRGVTKASRQLK